MASATTYTFAISFGVLALLLPTLCCLGYCLCRDQLRYAQQMASHASEELRRLEAEHARLLASRPAAADNTHGARVLNDRLETVTVKLEAARRLATHEAGVRDNLAMAEPTEPREQGWLALHPHLARWLVTMPLGVAAIVLFYADMVADVAVVRSLYATQNVAWAMESVAFVAAQYLACYSMVLVYCVRIDGGGWRRRTLLFAFFGYPLGPIILDALMFLEPLTLLPELPRCLPAPLAHELATLLPRYRRARVLVEVILEGIPQSVLELYIFLRMEHFAGEGFCLDVDRSHRYYEIDFDALKQSFYLTAISIAKLAFEYFYFWHAPDRRGQVFSYVGTILQLGYGTDSTNDGARTPQSVGFSPPRREPFSTQGDLLRSGSGPLARSPTTPARSHDDDRGLQGSSPFSPKLTILGSAALATSVIESTPFMV